MQRSDTKLDALAEKLERSGDDPRRLDLVQRARRFKRSWIELAEGLIALRQSQDYSQWGYGDLHEYCNKELSIRSATVDKLLVSFSTVQRHAPEVLQRDGVQREVPSLDAIDYFNRALGTETKPGPFRRLDAPDHVLDQLRTAVFEEGQNVRELRERFNPVLRPKAESENKDDAVRRARTAAQKLSQALSEVEGLTEARVARVQAAIEALLRDLDQLAVKPAARTASKAEHVTT
jgi:hypothetical protein